MTRDELEQYLRSECSRMTEDGEGWHFVFDDIPMQAFLSAEKDRMRIMSMVSVIEDVAMDQVAPILRINFHSDARYGLHDGILWAIYMHSLSSLVESDLSRGLRQLARLVSSFGKSFTSGPLRFEWPRPPENTSGVRRRTVEAVQEQLKRARRGAAKFSDDWDD